MIVIKGDKSLGEFINSAEIKISEKSKAR
jgi:hypothetical protein